jgi:hypothetical protein
MKVKPTAKELHDYCQKKGITAKTAGVPLNKLIESAHASDDPKGFLDLYSPGLATEVTDVTPDPPSNGESKEKRTVRVAHTSVQSGVLEAVVRLPYLEKIPPQTYVPDGMRDQIHIEFKLYLPEQIRGFERLWLAAKSENKKLANGRPVFSAASFGQWIFEQIIGEMEAEE